MSRFDMTGRISGAVSGVSHLKRGESYVGDMTSNILARENVGGPGGKARTGGLRHLIVKEQIAGPIAAHDYELMFAIYSYYIRASQGTAPYRREADRSVNNGGRGAVTGQRVGRRTRSDAAARNPSGGA